jgi:hypothetical protein
MSEAGSEPLRRIGVDLGAAPPPRGVRRTLAALEQVFPVHFEDLAAVPSDDLDAVLLGGAATAAASLAALPALLLASPPAPAARVPTPVLLSDDERLSQPLRGRSIEEAGAQGTLDPAGTGRGPDTQILAAVGAEPVWWVSAGEGAAPRHVSRYAPAAIEDGEALRDHLRAGSFMGLLPLVHFLNDLLGDLGWRLPPLRASFVVDDPNLHWPSYGFLKYRQLIGHAAAHGYHLGLATVPLDGWRADRRATALLAANPGQVSLLMHGNDHVAQELGRLTEDTAPAAIAQALRRIAALERRTGLSVERVMAPPHGACSEAALRAMFRLGLEAACISRPYPWRDGQPAPSPLAGWAPAELVAGGIPVLPRVPLGAPREDLALRALLGQPLILYGHHDDFAAGLDVLAQASADIDALGPVSWGPLTAIARAGSSLRSQQDTLIVRMHARRVLVEAPVGVRSLQIEVVEPFGGSGAHTLSHPGGLAAVRFEAGLGRTEPVALAATGKIELTLSSDKPLQAEQLPAPRTRLWPLLRRAAVEGRDRLAAIR